MIEISIITIHHHHIGNADVNKMVAIEELNRSQDIVMDDTNTLPSVNCVTPLVDHPVHGVDSTPCKELQQMYSTNKTFAGSLETRYTVWENGKKSPYTRFVCIFYLPNNIRTFCFWEHEEGCV